MPRKRLLRAINLADQLDKEIAALGLYLAGTPATIKHDLKIEVLRLDIQEMQTLLQHAEAAQPEPSQEVSPCSTSLSV